MTVSNKQLTVVGVMAFLLFTVLLMPAHLVVSNAIPRGAVSYASVDGDISDMTLRGTVWRGIPIGEVHLQPSLSAFLLGGFYGQVQSSGGKLTSSFIADFDEHYAFSNLTAMTDVTSRLGALNLTGSLALSDGNFIFDNSGQCLSGNAAVRTNILENALKAVAVKAPLLTGSLECVSGKLQLNLSGESSDLAVQVSGDWKLEGSVNTEFLISPKSTQVLRDSLKSALEFAGLSQTQDGWSGQLNMELF